MYMTPISAKCRLMEKSQRWNLILILAALLSSVSHTQSVDSTQVPFKIRPSDSRVESICSNGRYDLTASLNRDGEVYVWETTTGRPLYSLTQSDLAVSHLAFSHSGKFMILVSATRMRYYGEEYPDTTIVSIWDAVRGKPVNQFPLDHEASPKGIAFSSDDRGYMVMNHDRIQTYDASTGLLKKVSRMYMDGSFSPRGNYCACEEYHRSLAVWEAKTDSIIFEIKTGLNFNRTVSFPIDESILVSSGQDDSLLKVYGMPAGELRHSFHIIVPKAHEGSISPSGRYFAAGATNGEIHIWEMRTGALIQSYEDSKCGIWTLAWSPDEKLVLFGCIDGSIMGLKLVQSRQ